MAKEKSIKTNVMRILDQAGISYQHHHRDGAEHLSGAQLAALLEEEPDRVFKTLVTIGKSGAHYVFMIPVAEELDLKKAAAAVQENPLLCSSPKICFLPPDTFTGMFPNRHEKAVPHYDSSNGNALSNHPVQCRKNWTSSRNCPI